VRLPQSIFELSLLILRAFETGAHADKRLCDFRDFIASPCVERIAEIALPQGSGTRD